MLGKFHEGLSGGSALSACHISRRRRPCQLTDTRRNNQSRGVSVHNHQGTVRGHGLKAREERSRPQSAEVTASKRVIRPRARGEESTPRRWRVPRAKCSSTQTTFSTSRSSSASQRGSRCRAHRSTCRVCTHSVPILQARCRVPLVRLEHASDQSHSPRPCRWTMKLRSGRSSKCTS